VNERNADVNVGVIVVDGDDVRAEVPVEPPITLPYSINITVLGKQI
jgi:hypothetical protein